MLLKLEKLIAKYGMKITGVIQAGAHYGEEIDLFVSLGITKMVLFEPERKNFSMLRGKVNGNKYISKDSIALQTALGDGDGPAYMNVEEFNNGQSNSILLPKLHLKYYPDIHFKSERDAICLTRLDTFEYRTSDCNFLVMDVQGYELEVLKGATETLKHIDYIYTEVNREELYQDCAMIEDLDNYLTDFKRVQTVWKRKGFGDALYLRKTLL